MLQVEYSIESVTAESLNPEEINESVDDNSNQSVALEVFRVDGRSGALMTRAPLDREMVARYTVIVKATDQASPVTDRLSSTYVLPRLLIAECTPLKSCRHTKKDRLPGICALI